MSRNDRWTEGVCGDGTCILLDGVPATIEDVVATLNELEAQLLGPPVLGINAVRAIRFVLANADLKDHWYGESDEMIAAIKTLRVLIGEMAAEPAS